MIDYALALMVGIDIPIPDLQLTVHVPTIKDIAYMGERDFFTAVQYLCLEKEALVKDETLLASMTNFQVLMKVLAQSSDKQKKKNIGTLFTILFPQYASAITPNSIILTSRDPSVQHTVLIDNDNFEMFKYVLKHVLCVSSVFQRDNIVYNPGNAMAKQIADKLMRGRQRVAAQKEAEGQAGGSILTRYISILSVAQVSSIEETSRWNLFQLFDQMERYTAKVEWDIDLKVRLAGGKPDKTVETWMRDLHAQSSTAFNAEELPSGMKVY